MPLGMWRTIWTTPSEISLRPRLWRRQGNNRRDTKFSIAPSSPSVITNQFAGGIEYDPGKVSSRLRSTYVAPLGKSNSAQPGIPLWSIRQMQCWGCLRQEPQEGVSPRSVSAGRSGRSRDNGFQWGRRFTDRWVNGISSSTSAAAVPRNLNSYSFGIGRGLKQASAGPAHH